MTKAKNAAKRGAKKSTPKKKSGPKPIEPVPEREMTERERAWEKRVLAAFLFMTTRAAKQESVAKVVGVTARTIRNWLADSELWEAARKAARTRWLSEAEDAARAAVYTSIHNGNAMLGMDLLSRIDDQLAPRSKHEITGKDGGPIKTANGPDVDNMSDTDLAKLALQLAQELAK